MSERKVKVIVAVFASLGVVWAASALTQAKATSTSSEGSTTAELKGKPVTQEPVVVLSDPQAKTIQVVEVSLKEFALQREAVGYIDFNQDQTVAVSSPWAGRIKKIFVQANDVVTKGRPLYAIDSTDLVQAESTLIATSGVLQLTTKSLDRARKMGESQVGAQKDLDQATSDQLTAEANYKAARDAVRIFGKTDADVDRIVATKKIDGELLITSPLNGMVTTRSAAVGSLVQPGASPTPVVVSDLSSVWMVASVSEYDLPLLKLGQKVTVSVAAYPGKVFTGEINSIGASSDPATHRIPVRSVIRDPHHELRAQMLATFVLYAGQPTRTAAAPVNAVIRESDGTMSVFVTTDGRRFVRRPVKIGGEQAGFYPVESGLAPGEHIAADGALFLSNALALQTR